MIHPHQSDLIHPIRLRAISTRPDAPFEWDDTLTIEHCPHSLQIESANDLWLPFEDVFSGNTVLQPLISRATGFPLLEAIQRAGLWAMRHPDHAALRAIAARMPYVHYLAAGPAVLHHDPGRQTITVPGIADDLTILSDTAGRDIDSPTTSGGLIAVTYDTFGEHLSPGRPRIQVLHWAVPDEIFEDPSPQEAALQSAMAPSTALSSRPLRTYTAVLEYAATGEGMRHQVLVVPAEDEAGAKQAFLDRYYPESPDLQKWFWRGVDVYPGVHRPALFPMLGEHYLEHLERTARNGEFGLWHVFNLG